MSSNVLARGASKTVLMRSGGLVFGATLLWNLVNFAYNAVGARVLGPTGFGDLSVLTAMLAMIAPVMIAFSTVSSRVTTQLAVSGELGAARGLLARYLLRVGLASSIFALVAAALAGQISHFLQISSAWPVLLAMTFIPVSALSSLQRGVIQGSGRFQRLALSVAGEAAAKLVLMEVLLHVWPSVSSAVVSMVLAAALLIVVNAALLRYLPRRSRSVEAVPGLLRYSASTLATFSLLAVLFSVDVLAAKRYLPAHDAGVYSAVSLAGKVVYFATSSFTSVLFPWFSARYERGTDSRRALAVAVSGTLAISSMFVVVYYGAPGLVVGPLFGAGFAEAHAYAGRMAIALSFYAVTYLCSLYLLSQQAKRGVPALALLLVVQLGGLYARHGSIAQIVAVQVLVMGGSALLLAMLCLVHRPVFTLLGIEAAHRVLAPEVEIALTVKRRIGRVPVLLAGSRATREARPDSDYDLVVVLPLWRIPAALPRLARAAAELERRLGVRVSLNPLPERKLQRSRRNLFLWKLRHEGVVLAAPAGFELERRPPPRITRDWRVSYLMSALVYLVEPLDPAALAGPVVSPEVERGVRKAVTHAAQIRLLAEGRYASGLEEAVALLGDRELAQLAATAHLPATWFAVRDLVLRELGTALRPHRGAGAALANLRYCAMTALHGTPCWHVLTARSGVDVALADAAIALVGALRPSGEVLPSALARSARRVPPVLRPATLQWPTLRDVVVREWGNARPVLAG